MDQRSRRAGPVARTLSLAYLGRSAEWPLGRITLRGLDPDRPYRVRPLPLGDPAGGYRVPPRFAGVPGAASGPSGTDGDTPLSRSLRPDEVEGVMLSCRALATAGPAAPLSYPDRVWLVDVTAV